VEVKIWGEGCLSQKERMCYVREGEGVDAEAEARMGGGGRRGEEEEEREGSDDDDDDDGELDAVAELTSPVSATPPRCEKERRKAITPRQVEKTIEIPHRCLRNIGARS
jgi:hypothetical protein